MGLSIIVPCYNVEDYVEECLDSLVSQQFGGMELIVIDDASTDGTWNRIDRYRELPFVKLVKFKKNQGLGAVRNHGIKLARGDFLLFVDSDDWLQNDALGKLLSCVRNTETDLVFFDYARSYRRAGEFASPYRKLFDKTESSKSTFEKKDLLLDFPPMACFKVYRRGFILESGILFGEGFYEDISWSYPLTLLANRIELLPDVLYFYRQRRGSILKRKDDRHLDLITEYSKVLKYGKELQGGLFSSKLVAKAAAHYESILFVLSRRLSWKGLRKFFEQVQTQLLDLSPEERNVVINSAESAPSANRRRIIMECSYNRYLVAFLWFKMTYLITRPLQLINTYFSERNLKA